MARLDASFSCILRVCDWLMASTEHCKNRVFRFQKKLDNVIVAVSQPFLRVALLHMAVVFIDEITLRTATA